MLTSFKFNELVQSQMGQNAGPAHVVPKSHTPSRCGTGTETQIVVVFQAQSRPGWPAARYRLRGLLKVALRTFGFKAIDVRPKPK